MSGHRNVGGTPGWRALRGKCPVCGRDTATGPDYRPATDPLAGVLRVIKRHNHLGTICKGMGRYVQTVNTYEPPAQKPRTR